MRKSGALSGTLNLMQRKHMMRFETKRIKNASTRAGLLLPIMLLGGCARDGHFAPVDMWNRSRLKPYEPVAFFENNNSSRPLVAGTVARGQLRPEWFGNGTEGGKYLTELPGELRRFPMREVLDRGRERYNIYCTPCHGLNGYGDGMVVKRGFPPPPSYHIARLKTAPIGHFYDVISNGYGAMYSYAARVPPEDRWAIAEYIRVLQKSQDAKLSDVPQNLQGELQQKGRAGVPKEGEYIYPEQAGITGSDGAGAPHGQTSTVPREPNERGATKVEGAFMNPNAAEGTNRLKTPSAVPSNAPISANNAAPAASNATANVVKTPTRNAVPVPTTR